MSLSDEDVQRLSDWCEQHLQVQNPGHGPPLPLRWTPIQRDILARSRAIRLEPAWDQTVKPRQARVTTQQLCWVTALCVSIPGLLVVWVNQDEDVAVEIRDKFDIIQDSCMRSPGSGHPGFTYRNTTRYLYNNGSRVRWVEAGATEQLASKAGRSGTGAYAVLCEYGYWPHAEAVSSALLPSLEHAGAAVFVDSTPPEYEGMGAEYLSRARKIQDGLVPGRLFFWQWWHEPAYHDSTPAPPPWSEDEVALMQEHDLSLHQIQWRRRQIAEYGDRFPYVYPEALEAALAPKGAKAFSPAVIRRLSKIDALDRWPKPLDADALHAALPPHLRSETPGADMLLDPQYVRVWHPPQFSLAAEPVRQPTPAEVSAHGRLNIGRRLAQRAALAADQRLYILAIDPAQGRLDGSHEEISATKKRDWQVGSIIDPEGDIVARVRTRTLPLRFVSLCLRLAHWYGAHIPIEDTSNARLMHHLITSQLHPDEVEDARAHPIAAEPYRRCQLLPSNVKTVPSYNNAFLTHLNGLVIDPDPATFREMLAWNPETGEAKAPANDDILKSLGIGWWVRSMMLSGVKNVRSAARRGFIRRGLKIPL